MFPNPQNEYGTPIKQDPRQKRLQAMQKLFNAMKFLEANGQKRFTRPNRNLPVAYQSSAIPQLSRSESLASFAHMHHHDARCEGWIPIPGPSIVSDVKSISNNEIKYSYDNDQLQSNYESPNTNSLSTIIVVPEQQTFSKTNSYDSAQDTIDLTYSPPIHSLPQLQDNYGPPINLNSGFRARDVKNELPTQIVGKGFTASSMEFSKNVNAYHPSPDQSIKHEIYGVPLSHTQLGPIESSYGPPPSGTVNQLGQIRQTNQENDLQSIETDFQLPKINANVQFNNAVDIASSALGVAGNNEVVKSHTIHESHTSEVSFIIFKKIYNY